MLWGALGGQDLTLALRKTAWNSPLAFRNLFSRSGMSVLQLSEKEQEGTLPEKRIHDQRGAALLKCEKKQHQGLAPSRQRATPELPFASEHCFTWKWFYSGVHLYRGTNKNRSGHAAPHTSYKTLKETFKSFLASTSPLEKQELAGFPLTSMNALWYKPGTKSTHQPTQSKNQLIQHTATTSNNETSGWLWRCHSTAPC